MPDSGAALSLLGSVRELDDGDLPRVYGYPEHDRTWVRANFITSVDGGATTGGSSGAMGGAGDRLIFNLLRELADVIVVGAGTVRIEGYSGAQLSVTQRQHRQARGQSEVPQLAIVTGSGHLNRDMAVFTRTEVQPLVLTCAAAAEQTRRALSGLCEVLECSGRDPEKVDEAALLAALGARGMRRILTEGGPTLLDSLIRRDLLDELCLTIAPCLVGGHAPRIASGSGQLLTRMRCAHVLTDDAGYLYTRYVKA
ncbi:MULTISPECIES: pyrimidine reductase family protein [Mycobacterium]|uniref:Pyrimidine reductase family protein n=1 Tax=Mycobacterium colombiense TaxID=339268 RepID=A0A329LFE6_9MYCO|nr:MULTISPECIES: pyrimidine reductase family protein [Mycobacterium]MDM4143137.1 pyrimidine reductase family protein [Mycobacterium sp. FLAC0960]RAV05352.1 pyrimidine reductase family protein [Mycobacterium colombiense]